MAPLRLRESRDDARTILLHPDIFKTIAEDGGEVDMPDGYLYLCGYVPELVGCFIIHKQGKATVECHVQVLPDFREQYAVEFGDAVIVWMWEHTKAMKCVAQIPVIYPNVRDFALARGFEDEGINRASYLKGGELVDQWYMGIRK